MVSAFAEDVRHYLQLSPRQLPSMYLYDALGSALFDAICELPWYAITARRDGAARTSSYGNLRAPAGAHAPRGSSARVMAAS
jgi:uncharacterized SAM-dependent methyltransferase